MKKSIFLIIMTVVLVFAVGMVACNGKTPATVDAPSQTSDEQGSGGSSNIDVGGDNGSQSGEQGGSQNSGDEQGSGTEQGSGGEQGSGTEQGSDNGGSDDNPSQGGGSGEQGGGTQNPDEQDDRSYALYLSEEEYTPFVDGVLKETLKADDAPYVKDENGNYVQFYDWKYATVSGEYLFEIKNGYVYVTAPSGTSSYKVFLNGTQKYEFNGEVFSFKFALKNGDKVEVKSEFATKYEGSYVEGTYLFKVTESGWSVEGVKGASGKVTVYYSNSNKWQGDIYAYCWNDDSQAKNAEWPGVKCAYVSTNEYGESIYSYQADASLYDRIIFNNGSNQTKNLSLNDSCLGYYGDAGVYAYDKTDYGKSEKVTLSDPVNLAYRGGSKKIYVYTPAGYAPNNSYGVLVMFDAQNLFAHVEEVTNVHGAWAVDVAITSMLANRGKYYNGEIILGIDNSDSYRNSELTVAQSFGALDPRLTEGESDVEGFYNGHLDDLGNFILQTALPYVNEHYSTSGKVGICGSSSGGLGAYYLGLRDKNVYSYIGAFSPAVGLFVDSAWKAFYAKENFDKDASLPELFIYCGSGDNYLEDILLEGTLKIKKQLVEYGYPAEFIDEYYTENSEHTELWWRIAFSEFASKYL